MNARRTVNAHYAHVRAPAPKRAAPAEYNSLMTGGEAGRRVAVGVVTLVVVVGGSYALMQSPLSNSEAGTTRATAKFTPPPLSAAMQAVLAKSNGFQLLVSYTDRGFEPPAATIKKGQTVRFTHNSSRDLWVAATGTAGAVYPGTGKECGQSAFDSCFSLKPQEFWEFTFEVAGTWSYADNLRSEERR